MPTWNASLASRGPFLKNFLHRLRVQPFSMIDFMSFTNSFCWGSVMPNSVSFFVFKINERKTYSLRLYTSSGTFRLFWSSKRFLPVKNTRMFSLTVPIFLQYLVLAWYDSKCYFKQFLSPLSKNFFLNSSVFNISFTSESFGRTYNCYSIGAIVIVATFGGIDEVTL